MTEVRGALFDGALAIDCYRAVAARIAAQRDIDWVHWTGIDARSGGLEALASPRVRLGAGVACYVVELPSTFEALRASVSRNLREALRRAYNRLKRDGLAISLEVASAPAEVAPALEDFFRLHTARAQLSDTVRHRDVFDHPTCRRFLVDVCTRFAERGALRIYRLRAGGALVATRIGFRLGDTLYLYYSGFDPAYADYGVMTAAVAEAFKAAIAEGLCSVNLSTGRDVWKMGWRPNEIAYREALIFSPHVLGRAKYEALGAAKRAFAQSGVERAFARRA
jgi:CelD/BcsL family acetyltransferase involved in cellulose biosynthesis